MTGAEAELHRLRKWRGVRTGSLDVCAVVAMLVNRAVRTGD